MRCECVKCVCCDGFDCNSLVAGVRKGRGRELGRETTRERGGRREEGGGRKGKPARKPLFSPSRLLIKRITKITQL